MRKILAPVAALILGAAGVTLTAAPAEAAVGDVPADCSVDAPAYRSDGQRLVYGYAAGKTSVTSYQDDTLSWVPSALHAIHRAGEVGRLTTVDVAAHPTDGYLYQIDRQAQLTDGVWKVTSKTATRMAPGFADTRLLAGGGRYVFRVAGSSLYAYTVSWSDSGRYAVSAPLTLRTTGWDSVRTLDFARTEDTGDAVVDVLIGTKSNGELKEWRVNRATPTTIDSTTLRTSGWSGFSTLTIGWWCAEHRSGRPLLGITPAGTASVYFDANARDANGVDIKGGSLGSLGWTAKSYGW
ncbi:hypothetical protein [Actinosynnema sp. NPDC023587]|uniref:hypothetical protein n=1 Tax=Actinosynnema sp. NPDC023587 TaxID=3154695 RepID=UPI0033FCC2CA